MSDSQDRMRHWRDEDRSERDTLVTCPACKGNGKVLREDGRSYRMMPCQWCLGVTGVPRGIQLKFQRWLRIATAAKVRGRCPKT